jgi:hypothetical protein
MILGRLAALILSFTCVLPVGAQTLSTYRGTVLDAKGDAVVGAKVTAWHCQHRRDRRSQMSKAGSSSRCQQIG